VSFKESFEKVAFVKKAGLGDIAGRAIKAVGKKGLALAGGGIMGAANIAGTAMQASGDYGDWNRKVRAAQMR
jgi:hypothetical protein